MWVPIQDCGKQLTIYSRLREKQDNGYNIYTITEVEFDQYHLQLSGENDAPSESLGRIVNCSQVIEHGFEVEVS